ncbi:MAG: tyrosine-protein phosphatase [Anaerolineae bacterium]|nr:tyrosine-protein phosphatase [Anaerolineae bacterium]
MLRLVPLPESIPGRLYLSAMPGYYSLFEDDAQLITDFDIGQVFCLTTFPEIKAKAPEYAAAIRADDLPWDWRGFPVEDFGAPADRKRFLAMARDIADRLREGEYLLIHCMAGIGRTGMLAALVLMVLGMDRTTALARVNAAGGNPESSAQQAFLIWASSELSDGENG